MDSKHHLEITVRFDDFNDITRIDWQWRDGRCARNGSARSVEDAMTAAEASWFEFMAEGT